MMMVMMMIMLLDTLGVPSPQGDRASHWIKSPTHNDHKQEFSEVEERAIAVATAPTTMDDFATWNSTGHGPRHRKTIANDPILSEPDSSTLFYSIEQLSQALTYVIDKMSRLKSAV